MKQIKLHGKYGLRKVTLVDDEDFDELNKYHWRVMKNGYVVRSVHLPRSRKTTAILMHRFILKTEKHVDHQNNDRLDNQRHNLRPATQHQNNMHTSIRKRNKTGFKGVFFRIDRIKRPYSVKVGRVYVGHFVTPEEAALAYNVKAKELFGEFALLNDITLNLTTPQTRSLVT